MTLRIWSRPEHEAVAIGAFRPVILTLTCDAGGLFCETFERTTDERNGYQEVQSAATALE